MPDNHNDLSKSAADVLAMRLTVLHDDIREMKGTVGELTKAITKLALVEERQTNLMTYLQQIRDTATAHEKWSHAQMGSLDERIKKLEVAAPASDRTTAWVDRGIVFAVGAAFMYVMKKIGLLP